LSTTAVRPATASTTAIREEAVDKSFLETFLGLRLPPGEQRYCWQEAQRLKADNVRQQEQAVASCQLQLKQIEERINRLTDAYIDRLIDKDMFEQRKTALLSERLQAAETLASWESGKRNIAEELLEILERADAACLAYETSVAAEKREMVDSLTSNRLLNGKALEISLNSPFDLIATRSKSQDGSPQRDIHRTLRQLLSRIMKTLQRKQESQLTPAA
jgi:site-specific DNA recombinase